MAALQNDHRAWRLAREHFGEEIYGSYIYTPLLSSQCAFSSLCEVFSYPFSFAHCVTTKTWLTDEF